MDVLESDRYRETRAKLKADPIIIEMAAEIPDPPYYFGGATIRLAHDNGTPTHVFMLSCLDEYKERGGTIPTHIGGPAEAILALLKERAERSS